MFAIGQTEMPLASTDRCPIDRQNHTCPKLYYRTNYGTNPKLWITFYTSHNIKTDLFMPALLFNNKIIHDEEKIVDPDPGYCCLLGFVF